MPLDASEGQSFRQFAHEGPRRDLTGSGQHRVQRQIGVRGVVGQHDHVRNVAEGGQLVHHRDDQGGGGRTAAVVRPHRVGGRRPQFGGDAPHRSVGGPKAQPFGQGTDQDPRGDLTWTGEGGLKRQVGMGRVVDQVERGRYVRQDGELVHDLQGQAQRRGATAVVRIDGVAGVRPQLRRHAPERCVGRLEEQPSGQGAAHAPLRDGPRPVEHRRERQVGRGRVVGELEGVERGRKGRELIDDAEGHRRRDRTAAVVGPHRVGGARPQRRWRAPEGAVRRAEVQTGRQHAVVDGPRGDLTRTGQDRVQRHVGVRGVVDQHERRRHVGQRWNLIHDADGDRRRRGATAVVRPHRVGGDRPQLRRRAPEGAVVRAEEEPGGQGAVVDGPRGDVTWTGQDGLKRHAVVGRVVAQLDRVRRIGQDRHLIDDGNRHRRRGRTAAVVRPNRVGGLRPQLGRRAPEGAVRRAKEHTRRQRGVVQHPSEDLTRSGERCSKREVRVRRVVHHVNRVRRVGQHRHLVHDLEGHRGRGRTAAVVRPHRVGPRRPQLRRHAPEGPVGRAEEHARGQRAVVDGPRGDVARSAERWGEREVAARRVVGHLNRRRRVSQRGHLIDDGNRHRRRGRAAAVVRPHRVVRLRPQLRRRAPEGAVGRAKEDARGQRAVVDRPGRDDA